MRRAHVVLLAILVLSFGCSAVLEVTFLRWLPDGPHPVWANFIEPGYWVALLVLIYVWCASDAKDRGVSLPFGVTVLVPLLFPIGVPYYYFRTYPAGSAFLRVGLAALFAVACIAALKLGGKCGDYYLFGENA
jgi:hypothetical protein